MGKCFGVWEEMKRGVGKCEKMWGRCGKVCLGVVGSEKRCGEVCWEK